MDVKLRTGAPGLRPGARTLGPGDEGREADFEVSAFPRIDYASHPAYQIGRGERDLRRQALQILFPEYRTVRRRESKRLVRGLCPEDDIDAHFYRAGAAALELPSRTISRLYAAMSTGLGGLRARAAELLASDAPIGFKETTLVLPPGSSEFELVADVIERSGVLARVSRYFHKRPCAWVHHVALRENFHGETWSKVFFKGLAPMDLPLAGLHIDSASTAYLKTMIYLSDVGPENGPFRMVRGSQRWPISPFEASVRKAVDRTPLVSRVKTYRRMFAALPAFLQHRAEFGSDILADHDQAAALVAQETAFTSDLGNMVLFDPRGAHRGGYVRSGRRSVLQVTIKASAAA